MDIRKLSPGTRGVVLLLLYLALDDADDRPLIIDQPEENLDPKSVFDELVWLFITAKTKRQVIIVTHNANLVINTDADQIIIADPGPAPGRRVYHQFLMSPEASKMAISAKLCAIPSRAERRHSANVRGAFGCGLTGSASDHNCENQHGFRLTLAAGERIRIHDWLLVIALLVIESALPRNVGPEEATS